MASAFDIGGQIGAYDSINRLSRRRAVADGDDVGVVVPAGQFRRFLVPGQRRADAGDFVGRDLHADAAAADQNAAFGHAAGNALGHALGVIGIVYGIRRIGSQVFVFHTHFIQSPFDGLFAVEAGVIAGDQDFFHFGHFPSGVSGVGI